MVSFLPLSVLLAALSNEVSGAGYQVELPAALAAHLQRDEQTEWGRARVNDYYARDARGITYIFTTYRYPKTTGLKADKLRAVKDRFLREHKCVAATTHTAPIRTADAGLWPQTLFGGSCAAPGEYLILVLIASGQHYQLQVSNDPQPLPNESADRGAAPAWRNVSAHDLEQALAEFAGRCRFDMHAAP